MQLLAGVVVVGMALLAPLAMSIPQHHFGGHGGAFGGRPGRPGFNQGGLSQGGFNHGGVLAQVSPVVPILSIHGAVAPPSSCRRWCKTPEGSVYCCKNNFEPEGPVNVVKHGFCPTPRPVCNTRNFQPPANCASDGDCGGHDKCCFDRCLERHVCKYPDGIGFGGR